MEAAQVQNVACNHLGVRSMHPNTRHSRLVGPLATTQYRNVERRPFRLAARSAARRVGRARRLVRIFDTVHSSSTWFIVPTNLTELVQCGSRGPRASSLHDESFVYGLMPRRSGQAQNHTLHKTIQPCVCLLGRRSQQRSIPLVLCTSRCMLYSKVDAYPVALLP